MCSWFGFCGSCKPNFKSCRSRKSTGDLTMSSTESLAMEETEKSNSLQPIERLNVDGFLRMVGGFGKFQIILDIVCCIIMCPFTFHVLIMYFAALQPEWKCVENSTVCLLNGTFTSENDFRCQIPRSEWEYMKPREYSIVTEFDIYCDRDWMIYMTTSILFIGWMFGAIFIGWLADNYGRRKTMLLSIVMVLTASLIAPFVNNIYVFIIFRFIVGFFIPGGGVIMFVLISEIVNDKYRPLAGIILWVFFTLILCVMGLLAYLIPKWKILFIICTAPFFATLPLFKFIPESVRWLRLKGKIEEALEIFQRIADWNGRKLNPNASLSMVQGVEHSSNPLDLFKTKRMAIKTLIQGFAWMVNGMVYYGISLASDDLGGSLYLNYVLVSLIELPAHVFAIDFSNRFGRRKTTSISMILAGILTLVVAFIPKSHNEFRVMFGMLGKMLITVSFDVIYTWSVEIYPTNIRSEAMGFLQITSRIGAASAPWIAKAVKVIHNTLPFLIMGVLGLLAGIACSILPETKGQETQETENDVTEEVFFMDEFK
uniref:Major facilitator superfamily (MFS) profile domain-containing protein n=1 Tax=Clytia hemisphaerica TaxID=252671 RepID=A0A7M5WT68_9CNID